MKETRILFVLKDRTGAFGSSRFHLQFHIQNWTPGSVYR